MQTTISTNQIAPLETDRHILRRVLSADCLVCGISGTFLVLFSAPVATFLGVESSLVILVVGLVLLASAGLIFLTLRQRPLQPTRVNLVIGANVAWTAASLALLTIDGFNFTNGGKLAILLQAFMVADIALLEWIGWRRGR
jgi:hypothetical protein